MLSTKDLDNLLLEYDLESDPDYGVSYVYCLKCLQETGHSKRFRILKQIHFDHIHSDECYTLDDYKNEFTGVKTVCDEYSKFLSEKRREKSLDMWKNYTPEERQYFLTKRFGTAEERGKRTKNRWDNYTPEERERVLNNFHGTAEEISERNKKRWNNYTPEEKERVRERTKKMWENFTPEEREKKSKEISERNKKRWNNYTPEEKERVLNNFGTYEERSERTKNMWKNFTPEEREDFINKIKGKKRGR